MSDEQALNDTPFQGKGWGTVTRGVETMTEKNRTSREADRAEHGTQRMESDR